jgi:hypothetical protein
VPDRKAFVVFSRPAGLFSLYLQVLGQVFLCRQAGIVPIVYFNSRTLYWSDRGHNGARNVWEYYFEPVSDLGITDVVDAGQAELEQAEIWEFSRHEDQMQLPPIPPERAGKIIVRPGAIVSNTYPMQTVPFIWEMSARRKRLLSQVIRESIRVRPCVADKAARFRREQFRSNVLGVHIRGAEGARSRVFYAPGGLVPLERYFREIDAYIAAYPFSGIFCATDSQGALDALEERYGSRLVYYPATRLTPSDERVGLHNATPEGHSKAAIGEEVVTDWLLLGSCNHLLHGYSNVSLTARLINPMLPHLDVYRKYGYTWPKVRAPYLRYRGDTLRHRALRLLSSVLASRWLTPVRYAKRRLLRASGDVPA